MKVRFGFVSNSSSTSFVVIIKPKGGFNLTAEDYDHAVRELDLDLESVQRTAQDFIAGQADFSEKSWEIATIFDRYVFRHFSVNVYSDYGDIEVIDEENFKSQVNAVLNSIKSE